MSSIDPQALQGVHKEDVTRILEEFFHNGGEAKCPAAQIGHYSDTRNRYLNCKVEDRLRPGHGHFPIQSNPLGVMACRGDVVLVGGAEEVQELVGEGDGIGIGPGRGSSRGSWPRGHSRWPYSGRASRCRPSVTTKRSPGRAGMDHPDPGIGNHAAPDLGRQVGHIGEPPARRPPRLAAETSFTSGLIVEEAIAAAFGQLDQRHGTIVEASFGHEIGVRHVQMDGCPQLSGASRSTHLPARMRASWGAGDFSIGPRHGVAIEEERSDDHAVPATGATSSAFFLRITRGRSSAGSIPRELAETPVVFIRPGMDRRDRLDSHDAIGGGQIEPLTRLGRAPQALQEGRNLR